MQTLMLVDDSCSFYFIICNFVKNVVNIKQGVDLRDGRGNTGIKNESNCGVAIC